MNFTSELETEEVELELNTASGVEGCGCARAAKTRCTVRAARRGWRRRPG